LYLIEENGGTFDQYIDYLTEFGYQLINSSNLHTVSRETYRAEIPLRATTDIVAPASGAVGETVVSATTKMW